jgi:hypothetical protein
MRERVAVSSSTKGRHGLIGKTLGISTGTVQRVVMEQPRPFDVAEAVFACQ